jgi:Gram-negative porin
MSSRRNIWASVGMGVAALGLVVSPVLLSPVFGAPYRPLTKRPTLSLRSGMTTFTPASADPRLAAVFARSNMETKTFRFTPASSAGRPNRNLTVAVRARKPAPIISRDRPAAAALVASTAPTASLALAPVSYDLGVSVGWRRFAVSGDIAQADLGTLKGRRQRADVGVSYTMKKWTTRVALEAERPVGRAPLSADRDESVAVDFASSYRLSRNVDVMAGVRYKSQRDRLEPLADTRRDSQAVYVGTQFKF